MLEILVDWLWGLAGLAGLIAMAYGFFQGFTKWTYQERIATDGSPVKHRASVSLALFLGAAFLASAALMFRGAAVSGVDLIPGGGLEEGERVYRGWR